MKKNTMMRIASVLLVAVLLSTCTISGTFAKYVTEGSASDNARVAKWGVEFVTSSDLFQTAYAYDNTATGNQVVGTYSVLSSEADKNVVAPGTKGSGYTFFTNGAPEVSYQVTFNVDASETIYLVKNGATYYPVVFKLTLGDSTNVVTDTARDITAINNAINNCAYMYDVHSQQYYTSNDKGETWTLYGNTMPKLDLTWDWQFEQGHDAEDTDLGNLAAGKTVANDGYNLEVAFTVTATATQID